MEPTLLPLGCGINCKCGGIVRNDIHNESKVSICEIMGFVPFLKEQHLRGLLAKN